MRIEGGDIITDCPVCGVEYVVTLNTTMGFFHLPTHTSGGKPCPGGSYLVPRAAISKLICRRIERIRKMLKKRSKETT